MHLTHNEEKSAVAERFFRTLKNKVYKHMTVISKNVYFNVLNDIVDNYNNTYHNTIKMKSIDVKSHFIEYNEESDKKDKRYTRNWSEVFVISKIKNKVPWTYAINDLNGEEIIGTFYEK